MAVSIKSLELLPAELQECILEEMSMHSNTELIEIDGETYNVHKEVIHLIDSLILRLERMKSEVSKYKR